MKQFTGALLIAALIMTGASPVSAKTFKNCAELNAVYPGGVAKSKSSKNIGGPTKLKPTVNASVYKAVYKKLDRDKDGIACEVVAKATPAPSSSPSAQPDLPSYSNVATTSSAFADPNSCKLYSVDETSFSFVENLRKGVYPSLGKQKHFFAFVRFDDYSPEVSPSEWMKDFGTGFKDFYSTQSFGKLAIETEFNSKWKSIGASPSSFAWFGSGASTYRAHLDVINSALAALDQEVDYSKYDGVHVFFGTPESLRGGTAAFNSAPGNEIFFDGKRFASSSTYTSRVLLDWGVNSPKVLTHEFGHTLGLQDLYAYQKETDVYSNIHRFVGHFDMMGFVSARSPSMLNWNKWRLGWLENSNVYCLEPATAMPALLGAANQNRIPSLLVVKTSGGERLAFEYRPAGFDDLPHNLSGVVAYKISTSRNGFGSIQVQRKSIDPLVLKPEDYLNSGEERCFSTICVTAESATDRDVVLTVRKN